MNYITILTLIAFIAYLIYIGIIPSISDSYRLMDDRRWYHVFFLVVSLLIWLQNKYVHSDLISGLYMFAGLFFCCISLVASFWLKPEGPMHVVFTYSSITIGMVCTTLQLWPTYHKMALIPAAVLIVGGLAMFKLVKKNVTYWQEVLAIATVFIPIIPRY